MQLEGKSCAVTGAARGIGKGIALALAKEGARVVLGDLNYDDVQKVAEQIRSTGQLAVPCRMDVADRAQVRSMIDLAVAEYGELNVMVNNAGISQTKPFLDITEAEWDRIMATNGLGVLICTQEAARQMIAQGKGGTIINAGSIASREGYPLFAHYCASKHAVHALTTAAARAFAPYNITVNAYGPGVVATELWAQLDREFIALGKTTQPGEAMQDFSKDILLGRVSSPEDVSGLVVFLASPAAEYMTGQLVICDGGMVLW